MLNCDNTISVIFPSLLPFLSGGLPAPRPDKHWSAMCSLEGATNTAESPWEGKLFSLGADQANAAGQGLRGAFGMVRLWATLEPIQGSVPSHHVGR